MLVRQKHTVIANLSEDRENLLDSVKEKKINPTKNENKKTKQTSKQTTRSYKNKQMNK